MNPVRSILFFLFFPLCGFGQVAEKLPLSTVLAQIATAHTVKFTYIDEELAVYTLLPPDRKLSLKEKLDYLEKNTRLQFRKISESYYTVYNDLKMDKPLCGYLWDSTTGNPIENAQITVAGMASSFVSDDRGYFELPSKLPNMIHVRHLGYEQKSISPHDLYTADCPIILLTAVIEQLQEVITLRYLTSGISKIKSGDIVVKPGKFGMLPGLTEPDVLQTMQQIPGVASLDETVSNINVRGGTHDQNLFLWNGVRMFQTGHFFGLISAFNPFPQTNITISRNGSSAFFGESVSSLVTISSHPTEKDTAYTAVSSDMISANFLSRFRLSKSANLQVSGRRTLSDLFTSPTFKNYQDRVFQNTVVSDLFQNQQVKVSTAESFYFYDFSLQYNQKIGSRHVLQLDGIGIENGADIFQNTSSRHKNSELSQRNFGGSITWKTTWNSRHSTELQGYASWYSLSSMYESIEAEQVTAQNNTVFNKGFRSQHIFNPSDRIALSGGYQFDAVSITNSDEINDPSFSRFSKEVSLTHALAAETKFTSKNGKTFLSSGIRINYFDKFQVMVAEPRISFSQSLAQSLKMEVQAEIKSQTLSQLIDLH